MLAAKISIKTATTATKLAYNGVKQGSKALQKAGIGNDEVGKVLRGGEKVAQTTAKAGRAVVNTGKTAVNAGKTAVKAGKATVKGVKTGVKVAKKLGELSVKAIQLLIKFIQGVIALIKVVIATIAASEVLLIILVVILVAGLIAAAGFVAVYVINNGEFASSGGASGGTQSEQTSGGSNATWTEAYTTMFDWYVDNMPFEINGYTGTEASDLLLGCRYNTGKSIACDLIDGKNVGCFCSGYVQASLQYSGIVTSDDGLFDMNSTGTACSYLQAYIDSNRSTSGSAKIDSVLEKFDLYTYADYTSGKYKPEAGDIVIKNGHMEIYGGLKNDKATKFTWGESYFREDGKHCSSQDCSNRYLKKGEPGTTDKSEADYVKKYSYFLKLKAGASSSQATTEEASTTEESTTEATTASE